MENNASKNQRTDKAMQLLKETSWFHDASDSLLQTLASAMKPFEAVDGHILVEEGEEIENIIILEEGTLARTKLSVEDEGSRELKASFKRMPPRKQSSSIIEHSIYVDTIEGRARVSGLLHNVKPGSRAFATVTAVENSKVWLISGDCFRDAIKSNPEHAIDVMFAMARELRVGSKSLRNLMKKIKTGTSSNDDDHKENEKVCRVLFYDASEWVKEGFTPAVELFNEMQCEQGYRLEIGYTSERLGLHSATYAAGYDAVCLFVNDTASSEVLQTLSLVGVRLVAMRCAGFDRVDTKAARAFGLTVARVPAYSPHAVAEMAIALLMAVNRKVSKATNRVRMANFTLDAGLLGIDIHGKTVGVMGTGKIGQILCNIMLGFGVNLLCYDVCENEEVKKAGGIYVSKDEIFSRSDVLFLMMPLLPPTYHTINENVLPKLKRGVILINTSRGGLVDTDALLKGLQEGQIGGVGMDVYENEHRYFFQDWSARHIEDPNLVALLGETNVVLTAHQAFFTKEAIEKIVKTTIDNIHEFQKGKTGVSHPNNCVPLVK